MKRAALFLLALAASSDILATNYVSVATGPWSTPSTWSPAGVPTSSDNVRIATGTRVFCDSESVGELIVEGELELRDKLTAARVEIASGGDFAVLNAILTVGTDTINRGTLHFHAFFGNPIVADLASFTNVDRVYFQIDAGRSATVRVNTFTNSGTFDGACEPGSLLLEVNGNLVTPGALRLYSICNGDESFTDTTLRLSGDVTATGTSSIGAKILDFRGTTQTIESRFGMDAEEVYVSGDLTFIGLGGMFYAREYLFIDSSASILARDITAPAGYAYMLTEGDAVILGDVGGPVYYYAGAPSGTSTIFFAGFPREVRFQTFYAGEGSVRAEGRFETERLVVTGSYAGAPAATLAYESVLVTRELKVNAGGTLMPVGNRGDRLDPKDTIVMVGNSKIFSEGTGPPGVFNLGRLFIDGNVIVERPLSIDGELKVFPGASLQGLGGTAATAGYAVVNDGRISGMKITTSEGYYQSSGATLGLAIRSDTDFDSVTSLGSVAPLFPRTGPLSLAGNLELTTTGGVSDAREFTLIDSPARTGEFRSIDGLVPSPTLVYSTRYTSGGLVVQAAITPTIVSFTATPDAVEAGGAATLRWTTIEAQTVSIAGLGTQSTNGSLQVNPQSTTTYTLTATASGGSVTASVTVRVTSAPRVVATALPAVLVQESGSSQLARTELVLSNTGTGSTTVSLRPDATFFTLDATEVVLAAGASRSIAVSGVSMPVGSYSGTVRLSGSGVPADIRIGVQLLSYGKPGATIPDVEAVRIRVDVGGADDTFSGAADFRNIGSSAATGVLASDEPWLIPQSGAITIAPGATVQTTFVINRALRPADSQKSVISTLRFVYPPAPIPQAGARSEEPFDHPGHYAAGTIVVDTRTQPKGTVGLPPLRDGEVAISIPGVRAGSSGGGRLITDMSIGTPLQLIDLRRYFLENSSAASQAISSPAPESLAPGQSLKLADVAGTDYGRSSGVGSLHLRSTAAQHVRVVAFRAFLDDSKQRAFVMELPVIRSDRGLAANQTAFLPGIVSRAAGSRFILTLQELTGRSAIVTMDFLDSGGAVIRGEQRAIGAFEAFEDVLVPPAGAVSVAMRNSGEGKVVPAILEELPTGDTRLIVDSSVVAAMNRSAPQVIVGVASSVTQASSPPRRRGVRRGGSSGKNLAATSEPRETTMLVLMNPSPSPTRVDLQLRRPSGPLATGSVTLNGRETKVFEDPAAVLFGVRDAVEGSIVILPTGEGVSVHAWRSTSANGEVWGTNLPVVNIEESLAFGGTRVLSGIADASESSRGAQLPGTYVTRLTLHEYSGKNAVVRVSVTYPDARSLAFGGTQGSKSYNVSASSSIEIEDVIADVAPSRRSLSGKDLHDVQLTIEVTSPEGRVLPVVESIDNSSGDVIVRVR